MSNHPHRHGFRHDSRIGAFFLNVRQAVLIRKALTEMGHLQPPTPIKTNSATSYSIRTANMHRKRSKAFDMRFHWMCCRIKKSILPGLAEGNRKPCQSLHQSLPSQTPPTDKVCIPSTCEFANILSTQYSSAGVCVPSTSSQAIIHSRLTARVRPPRCHIHDYMMRTHRALFLSMYMTRAYRTSFISTYEPRA